MAKQLQSTSISAPGFLGLNTQESAVDLADGYALIASNVVIDKFGRIGARKGWVYRTTALEGVDDDNVDVGLKGMHNFIDLAGVKTYLSWSDSKFYKGYGNLEELTPTTTDTITDGDWQCVSLNDRAYYFQRGYKPLYYTNETTTDEFKSIENHADYTGTAPQANAVLSAYGRLWAADTSTNKTTVFFSNLLNGAEWSGGSSGRLNITGTFSRNSDVIVGLGAFNGTLVVFCKNSILIFADNDSFEGSFDPTSLSLVEAIEGVGCISRDTIQHTGEDILFLSATGVRSLGRTIQEKSQPFRDISRNVRDDVVATVENESDPQNIKAVYSPVHAFYLLTFPQSGFVFCFDTRAPLQDGSYRATQWELLYHTSYLYDSTTRQLLMTNEDGIAEYFGYQDNGKPYRMRFFTSYDEFGQPVTTKIAKRVGVTVIGPQGQDFIVKIGTDYTTTYRSYGFVLSRSGKTFEYNIGEYDIAEYSGGLRIENIRASVGGQGVVLQAGLETEINGAPFSLQRLDVYAKSGRVL